MLKKGMAMRTLIAAFCIACLPAMIRAGNAADAPAPPNEEFLLSDNIPFGASTVVLPDVKVLPTGATRYPVTEGEYATDTETQKTAGRNLGRLFDGQVGRNGTITYSTWDGRPWATLVVDLKAAYPLTRFVVWVQRGKVFKNDAPNIDTEFVDVWLSQDGKSWTCHGTAKDDKTPLTANRYIPLELRLARPVLARFVQFRIKRRASSPQQRIGDVAVFGRKPAKGRAYLAADAKLPIRFSIIPVEEGAVVLDWKAFSRTVRGVSHWNTYRSRHAFHAVTEDGVHLVARDVPRGVTRKVVYPLTPETTYYFAVTGVYGDKEAPAVYSVEYTTPAPLTCKTFGDMLAVNHYRWHHSEGRLWNREAWADVALEILGIQSPFKQIRWYKSPQDILEKTYSYGVGVLNSGYISKASNCLGMYTFEVANEPDLSGRPMSEYLDRLKKVYTLAKSENKHNVVGAPTSGLEHSSIEWLDRFLAAGGGKYMDYLNLHTYCKTSGGHVEPEGYPRGAPEALYDSIRRVRAVMRKHGLEHLPMVSGEFGYSDARINSMGVVTPQQKAQYLVRGLILHYVLGFRRVFVYAFQDAGTDVNYSEHRFGLVDFYLQKKPAFYAVATLGDRLGSCVLKGPLPGAALPDIGYLFFNPKENSYVAVVWNGAHEAVGTFRTNARDIQVTDMMGHTRKVLADDGGTFRIPYGASVVYIESAAPVELVSSKKRPPERKETGTLEIEVAPVIVIRETEPLVVHTTLKSTLPGRVAARASVVDAGGNPIKNVRCRVDPGPKTSVDIPLKKPGKALDRYTLRIGYDTETGSWTVSRSFYVRQLVNSGGKPVTCTRSFIGCPKPIHILSGGSLEVSIDASRGGRVIEMIPKSTGRNQLRFLYEQLDDLVACGYDNGIFDFVNGQLKLADYKVLEAGNGGLVLEAENATFRVRKEWRLDGKRVTLRVFITNRSAKNQRAQYYLHPEYCVGGTADAVTDVRSVFGWRCSCVANI